jgi:DNA mismatch repair ATPase MutS
MERRVVGNTVDAGGRSIVIITGANQGGKSIFLRSIGLAQVMMQSGMFVAAESFGADLCTSLFTHYKREEDATMKSGKLDEELARMSDIVDHLAPNSLLLFNESFAATNEREGSEIARQIVRALLETRNKVFFVTHRYEFAHGMFDTRAADAIFLRAERRADGTRTLRLLEGEPLETSYGEDVYREVFAVKTEGLSAGCFSSRSPQRRGRSRHRPLPQGRLGVRDLAPQRRDGRRLHGRLRGRDGRRSDQDGVRLPQRAHLQVQPVAGD